MAKAETDLKNFLEKKYQIKINRNQVKALLLLHKTGFFEHRVFPQAARNRPFNALDQWTLVDFDFGPKDFAFQTYGYMLTEKAKVILEAFFKENENHRPQLTELDKSEWIKNSNMCKSLAFALN